MYAARLLGCEDDGNAGVGYGGGVVAVSAYISLLLVPFMKQKLITLFIIDPFTVKKTYLPK